MTGIPFHPISVATTRLIASSLTVLVLAIGMTACGGDAARTAPGQSAAGAPGGAAPDIAAADGATAFFHEQLVTNGEDLQSDFGSALLTLGMNPRDLQQDTPEHAYQTVLQKVQEVKDDTLRRELTRALFGLAGRQD